MKTIQTGGRSPASTTLTVASQRGNAKRSFAWIVYAAFALVSDALMGASHARAEGLLALSYVYPADMGATQWSALATAVMSVPITVILNPSSGPDTTQDANYVVAIAKVRVAGGKVTGYVSSSYTNRPLSVVMQDINTYQTLYQVDGFSVDEMTADSVTAYVQSYQSVYNYIKGSSSSYAVTGNPGINVPEIYASLPVTDQLVVFEDSARHYTSYAPLAWQANYSTARFAHIAYVASAAQMQTFVRNASGKGAATVFIINKTLSNPYGVLSTYWSREVSATAVAP